MLMSIGMVGFWAFVIYGVLWLIRGGQTVSQRDEPPAESPEDILKRRLAQGEMSVEEYRRLLETLDEERPQHSRAA